jgi:hypothetical protein
MSAIESRAEKEVGSLELVRLGRRGPGVNAQERTREELLASLRAILAEVLEFNRKEARAAADSDF